MDKEGTTSEDINKSKTVPSAKKKTILLVGRSGNGKSSIGNMILGETKFKTHENEKQNLAVAENNELFVLDCTGIGDTKEDIYLNKYTSVSELAEAAVRRFENFGGIDLVVFVLKFGVRFTKQEKNAVQIVRNVFGEDVFRDWVVLAFSYGDMFTLNGANYENFNDWCREQGGDIKSFFEEVNYRCVLFDNRTDDRGKQMKCLDDQIRSLLSLRAERKMPDKFNLQVYRRFNQMEYKNCCQFL